MSARATPSRISTRIVMWSFVPTTIILLAVALTIYAAYQRVTEDLVVGRNEQLVHLSARQLAADLAAYADTLSSLTHTADMYAGDPATQTALLSQQATQLLVFDGGGLVLDPAGRVVAAGPEQKDRVGQDWSDRDFYRQLIRSGAPTFSDVFPAGDSGAVAVVVAVPIRNEQGAFRGVLAGLFRLGASSYSAFYGGIVKLRLGEMGSTYLVDGTGRVIYHPDPAVIGTQVGAQPAVQQVLKGQVGHLHTRGLENEDSLASFAPVPGTSWGLIDEEDWGSLLAASRGYGQSLFLLLALGVVIPALVVAFGVRRITRPVTQLIAAAKEIAGGNYGQRITLRTGDELEQLVSQFNRMSEELQESYAQLESRVAARTRELAALNTIAAVASRSLRLDEILSAALDETLQVLGMDMGCAYSLEEGDARLSLVAQRGLPDALGGQLQMPLQGSAIEGIAPSGQPAAWLLREYPEEAWRQSLEQAGVEQVLCAPLVAKGRLVGAFIMGARRTRPIAAEELSLLAAIGQQIGIAVENARLYDQAQEAATAAERARLARELHDSVTQSLYSVTLFAEASASLLAAGDYATAAGHLTELRDTAQEALREMRLLIFELRPPALEREGLSAALQERLEAVEARGGMKSDLHVDGQEQLPPDVQEELYHIAQEMLNNVIKHAHAQRVQVRLRYTQDCVHLEIEDDGVGFDPACVGRGGMGLDGMRERAARIGAHLAVESMPGQGTRMTVHAPFGAGRDLCKNESGEEPW